MRVISRRSSWSRAAPLLARIDWLEIRLWAQGERRPVVVRMQTTDELRQLALANATLFAPNLIISYTGDASWTLRVHDVTDRIVHRAEVECALAMTPVAPLVGISEVDLSLAQAEHLRSVLAAVTGSASWRLTRPLRALKELLGR